jgi:hypothetical protein
MGRRREKKRELRSLAAPFTIAAPSGARIRDRLRLNAADERVLTLAGEHLGGHQRSDLTARVTLGNVSRKDTERAARKRKLTAVSSSRWAGAMTLSSEDQYQLSVRCLYDERAGLRRAIHAIGERLAVPCGRRKGRTRGYADHLAAVVLDGHGNPIGAPHTVPLELTGPGTTRDGRLRTAITGLLGIAKRQGCAGLVIENLGFADARATGRETMGRGRRGKQFRRTVAGIPTARFRERLRGMACHAGLVVIAVDPAYTSIWGGRYWQRPLQQQTKTTVTRHHGAAMAIGRRGLGHRVRRRPGATAPDQRIGQRRATGQTGPLPRPRGTTSPPRTTGTPPEGGKTRLRRGDQLVLLPGPQDRSEGHRTTCPNYCELANFDQ